MKILTGVVYAAWTLIAFFTLVIVWGVANAYVGPEALIILVPVCLMGICQLWFGGE